MMQIRKCQEADVAAVTDFYDRVVEYLVIHALAIATDRRGKGLGEEIVNFCIEEARKKWIQSLKIGCST